MGETFRTIWDGLDWSVLTDMILAVIPALICITLHEVSHGLAAYALGDTTAKDEGRLSLNPLKHLDVFGLAMMVCFHFGWAKPVPVNMNRFKNPKRDMAITALAGPVSNVIISVIFLLLYGFFAVPLIKFGSGGESVADMLNTTAYLSLAFAVFNIIPIPPLDGSKVLFSFMPEGAYRKLMQYERFGMIILLVAVSTGVLGTPLNNAVYYIYNKLFIIAQAGLSAGSALFA